MSERIYIANSNSLLLFQSQSRESIFEAHPQRFQTTGKPDLSKASFLASLLLPDFDRWSHDRNTAELHRRAGIRRVAPFIPTQALRRSLKKLPLVTSRSMVAESLTKPERAGC